MIDLILTFLMNLRWTWDEWRNKPVDNCMDEEWVARMKVNRS